ncbi:Gfo/Idh/MocA family oxidoreductase [Silicimonas algicola]|uniref:Putative dehydrogenase n=1 Tax=Silicimonas algicola TaxID=1826607 RepID=A0A316GA48_9RHOB|nr:Gfo/Idh/MocA family oxidoreductase [Silicimonas algicola]AZQ67784.1 Gfo/Idh/MocA family oxidoreductase [Silicimonas algicola]PWK57801.1 putative dehydrogenase [Silicimonas algicola]
MTLGVGIIGCGNISAAYLRLAPLFRGIEVRAVADLSAAAAEARATEFGVRAETVEGLLAAKDIDIVVNLTIPAAHFAVSKAILEAGKHVYSEKPFVLSLEEGADLKHIADTNGLRIGSAPDTFLGGAHQQARALIDDGTVGQVTSGTAFVMSHGMEHWHPNPDFFFLPGAGPVLDIGPYYVTNLIQLLGPVKRVVALTSTPSKTRTISSDPRKGETIPVETPTTIHALLDFASGAVITMATSWDVWGHGHKPMELYGTEASLDVPDPNFFGGDLILTEGRAPARKVEPWDHPFGKANQDVRANYRTAGLADMAIAIAEHRPHRCSMELALHAVEVMTGILKSGETGSFVKMTTTCSRPAALDPAAARDLLA